MSKKPNGYWTYERCKGICLKYNKKNILQKEYPSVYNAIFNNKWFELYDLIYDDDLNTKIKELYE